MVQTKPARGRRTGFRSCRCLRQDRNPILRPRATGNRLFLNHAVIAFSRNRARRIE
jgi:hypothetical protein